jgi:hypothetical protein
MVASGRRGRQPGVGRRPRDSMATPRAALGAFTFKAPAGGTTRVRLHRPGPPADARARAGSVHERPHRSDHVPAPTCHRGVPEPDETRRRVADRVERAPRSRPCRVAGDRPGVRGRVTRVAAHRGSTRRPCASHARSSRHRSTRRPRGESRAGRVATDRPGRWYVTRTGSMGVIRAGSTLGRTCIEPVTTRAVRLPVVRSLSGESPGPAGPDGHRASACHGAVRHDRRRGSGCLEAGWACQRSDPRSDGRTAGGSRWPRPLPIVGRERARRTDHGARVIRPIRRRVRVGPEPGALDPTMPVAPGSGVEPASVPDPGSGSRVGG